MAAGLAGKLHDVPGSRIVADCHRRFAGHRAGLLAPVWRVIRVQASPRVTSSSRCRSRGRAWGRSRALSTRSRRTARSTETWCLARLRNACHPVGAGLHTRGLRIAGRSNCSRHIDGRARSPRRFCRRRPHRTDRPCRLPMSGPRHPHRSKGPLSSRSFPRCRHLCRPRSPTRSRRRPIVPHTRSNRRPAQSRARRWTRGVCGSSCSFNLRFQCPREERLASRTGESTRCTGRRTPIRLDTNAR
jgi:hypothetical protein